MKQQRISNFLLSLFLLFSFSACVSVDIKAKPATKSIEYTFQTPSKIFKSMDSDQTDHAWQNQKNGNTIAVLTECSENKDPALTSLEGETIQALNGVQLLHTENITFADRGALRTQVEGQVDGVSVRMDLLTFKKNTCNYTLTYVGRSKSYDKDHAAFEDFLKGFVVP